MANDPRQRILDQLEAQRFQAEQAAREQAALAAWNNALELAGTLALDPKRKGEGRAILAREWAAYRQAEMENQRGVASPAG